MKHRLLSFYLLLALILPVATTYAEPAPPAENLSSLIENALANNPELKSSAARWQMYRSRAAQAGALEDPMLMFKIQNGIVTDPLSFTADSMTQKVIGISQQLPFAGKRKLKEEIASKEAETYRWSIEERKLELTRMVKEAYYQIYFTDKSLGILEKNIKIIDDFITLAQTKYSVGQGAQQDIYKALLERSRMLDMQITLEQQRRSLEANLNSLLNRSQSTPVGRIADFKLTPLDQTPEQLWEVAEANRPQLKALRAQIEKGRAGHELARKESYPDFNVSFEYMQRQKAMGSDGSDMYSLGVTFNLPIQKERRQAMVAESSSEVTMAGEELAGVKNTITSGIADLLAQLERRKKLVDLYSSGIIPQASESLESAVIGYRVNKVDFLTLLDNRVTLFNYEREYYDSMADYQMKLAQLEALIGKEL
ncbi:CzcABC family efflux RND transporter, outer membrane protein [Citrifermentans bremense]|uniref:CzcABC family efflux RND transporter, outer membrane protein n=1 Tax=Citrifermentans bremense TaxID=60035 RepID=A0A6S6M6E1_9BACT|nr:TolC family protein [Citrifermentans bremense]BCG47274.1 CzcABC family efflux RND transporter, outer membrane protein [Citrifermentans bremense]